MGEFTFESDGVEIVDRELAPPIVPSQCRSEDVKGEEQQLPHIFRLNSIVDRWLLSKDNWTEPPPVYILPAPETMKTSPQKFAQASSPRKRPPAIKGSGEDYLPFPDFPYILNQLRKSK